MTRFPPRMSARRCGAAMALLALLVGVACGGDDDGTTSTTAAPAATATKATTSTGSVEPLRVVTSFYPLEEAARAIAGDRATVFNLTPPGAEPHDLELTAEAAGEVEQANLVLYLGQDFQPEVQRAVDNLPADVEGVDVLEGLDLRVPDTKVSGVQGEPDGEVLASGKDPHVWVDPARFITIAEGIRDALAAEDPAGADTYAANAESYLAGLRQLDSEFEAGLSNCKSRVLVTSHAAFGYLADRYELTQAPIAGISPEEEPDPQSLAATAAFARDNGVKTVFFESLVPPDLAETVASEIGAKTDKLDPVEGIPDDELAAGTTYSSIQRANLASLEAGLQCTDS